MSCDQSLNQFTVQGIIDEFGHIGAVPIGVYSNQAMWSMIMGGLPVSGVTADWYASGTGSAAQAKAYCNSADSFTGSPVSIVQFFGTIDQDYAC